MSDRIGKVYLVGSGVGSLAHLTVRAQQLLSATEVLVYDALVDADLLQLVPENCLKLDVGKRGGKPSPAQAEINQLLIHALSARAAGSPAQKRRSVCVWALHCGNSGASCIKLSV